MYAAATNAISWPVSDIPPSTPLFVLLNVVIKYTFGSMIPISLAAVSDAATAIADMNRKLAMSFENGFDAGSSPLTISATKLANAIAVGIAPFAAMFLQVRSPFAPSWKPSAFFQSNRYLVAPKLVMRNTSRRSSQRTLPHTPMIMPTTNAPSEPERSNIRLRYDRMASVAQKAVMPTSVIRSGKGEDNGPPKPPFA